MKGDSKKSRLMMLSALLMVSVALCSVLVWAIAQLHQPLNHEPQTAEPLYRNEGDRQNGSGTLSKNDLTHRWIISAPDAQLLIQQGATLLDARGSKPINAPRLQGAVSIQWQTFSQSDWPHRGKLIDDDAELEQRLQAIGISNHVPVIVFGDPQKGWGEEGRIVWMLKTLGHSQVVWVDGGVHALIEAGVPPSSFLTTQPTPKTGNFTLDRHQTWAIALTFLGLAHG